MTEKLRIGDKVRAHGDRFIEAGTEGIVVNVVTSPPYAQARARILFETDQVCIMDADEFDVIPRPNAKPQQPVVMEPFPGSAA